MTRLSYREYTKINFVHCCVQFLYLPLANTLVPVAGLCVRRNVIVRGAHMVTASLLKKDDKCATLQIKNATTLNPSPPPHTAL